MDNNQLSFVAQILLGFILIITSLINLTLGIGDQSLWVGVLGATIGLAMPSPLPFSVNRQTVKSEVV